MDAVHLHRQTFGRLLGSPRVERRRPDSRPTQASFTLDTYIHLLPEEMPEPDFLDGLTGGSEVAARQAETAETCEQSDGDLPAKPKRTETGRDRATVLLIPRSKVRILHGPLSSAAKQQKSPG